MSEIFFIQSILSFFARCSSKKCINNNKSKLLFRFGQGKWIAEGVYCAKKITNHSEKSPTRKLTNTSLTSSAGTLKLLMELGAGKSLRFIPIHQIARSLGPDQSSVFQFFHVFSGCDTTSSLSGNARKVLFDMWTSMDDITLLFQKLPSVATPNKISGGEFELLEFFVEKLYLKTCHTKEVNEARGILFYRDNKVIGNIRPTKGALIQHVLRSVLQSSKLQQSLQSTC